MQVVKIEWMPYGTIPIIQTRPKPTGNREGLMCGIIGYIGRKQDAEAVDLVLRMLAAVEYRGYDSAGIAGIGKDGLKIIKKLKPRTGSVVAALRKRLGEPASLASPVILAHTRWATHGKPSEQNAHPQVSGKVVVVHNGTIENYLVLKKWLEQKGIAFQSETDTEVVAALIDYFYRGDPLTAVNDALSRVEGAYALCVAHLDDPTQMIVAKNGSDLVIHQRDGEVIVCSDPAVGAIFSPYYIYLKDGDIARIKPGEVTVLDSANELVAREPKEIDKELEAIDKRGYEHFMLKEIHEQPLTVARCYKGRFDYQMATAKLGGIKDTSLKRLVQSGSEVNFVGCGTSYNAAMVGALALENVARIRSRTQLASELISINPVILPEDNFFCLSQSGATADVIKFIQEAIFREATCLGIVNVVGSTVANLTHESGGGVYTRSGREVGVAATKTYTGQLAVLTLLTLLLARKKELSLKRGKEIIRAMEELPEKIQRALDSTEAQIKELAKTFSKYPGAFFLGRGFGLPSALEGALKLKEVSYVHAEGYPAGESKHGPIALIDENFFVVFVATDEDPEARRYVANNISEMKARFDEHAGHGKSHIIIIGTEGDRELEEFSAHVVYLPSAGEAILSPILHAAPLQLFAYYMALERGHDPDQPRNLAKSVTVT